ncbi:MAG TPA: DUF4416 family protein [Acidobacteriota bacterium]|nr:DUF4416 family protein [Acidobacteriota bacterium]
MADPKPFTLVKLVCGIISSAPAAAAEAERRLAALYGAVDLRSPAFSFDLTDYYEAEMGPRLERRFLSFAELIRPEALAGIKLRTNALEEEIRHDSGSALRVVNLDPGYVTAAALIMATAKDFAHRIPLREGIYAHLEFLFSRTGVKILDWTYPDLRGEGYREFFRDVRTRYLKQRA